MVVVLRRNSEWRFLGYIADGKQLEQATGDRGLVGVIPLVQQQFYNG
jgi:hypothetical protein